MHTDHLQYCQRLHQRARSQPAIKRNSNATLKEKIEPHQPQFYKLKEIRNIASDERKNNLFPSSRDMDKSGYSVSSITLKSKHPIHTSICYCFIINLNVILLYYL